MSTLDKEPTTTNEQDNNRRDFLLGSALAAGAITSLATSAGAEAQVRLSPDAKRRVSIAFDSRDLGKITREEVFGVMEQIFDIAGCPTCGLGGFDLDIHVNPVLDLKANVNVKAEMQI